MLQLLQSLAKSAHLSAPLFFALLIAGLPVTCVAAEQNSSKAVELALRQSQIADRYRQLETMLLKMAEYDSSTNPRRAALLRQALAASKQKQVNGQLNDLVKLFQREQLQKAVDGQVAVKTDLKALLDLLLSEDRPDRLKNEQARVRGYINSLNRIIRQVKSIQGRTEGGADTDRLAQDQEKVADKTRDLGKEIDEAEGLEEQSSNGEGQDGEKAEGDGEDSKSSGEGKASEGESDGEPAENQSDEGTGEGESNKDKAPPRSESEQSDGQKPKDGESGEGKSGEGQAGKGKSSEGKSGKESENAESEKNSDTRKPQESEETPPSDSSEGQPSQGQPSQGQPSQGQPSQGQPSQGQPSQGQPSQGQPSQGQQGQQQQQQAQQEFPGRKRIAAAEDRMRQAQKDLEEAKREDAVEQQEEARRQLEIAKAELEEILRQLREEEIERVLAMLEGRFRRMLEMELKIQDSTIRLSKTPASKRTRQFTVKSGKLSLDQRKVILEVDKALTLLREEGSSVAFPEAAEQMRVDMDTVARRLSEEKVGELTLAIEADIVTALEEMIAALQKAQQDAEERRQEQQQQQQQQQQGDPSNQPLVNKIAELKMIRALQMRVNSRTQRFAKMLTDFEDPVGQATDDDLLESIQELSGRQKRIHKVTSDIVLEKNQ